MLIWIFCCCCGYRCAEHKICISVVSRDSISYWGFPTIFAQQHSASYRNGLKLCLYSWSYSTGVSSIYAADMLKWHNISFTIGSGKTCMYSLTQIQYQYKKIVEVVSIQSSLLPFGRTSLTSANSTCFSYISSADKCYHSTCYSFVYRSMNQHFWTWHSHCLWLSFFFYFQFSMLPDCFINLKYCHRSIIIVLYFHSWI